MRKLGLALLLLTSPAFGQTLGSPPGASGGGGGSGTVTSVSVTSANGVSGTVVNPSTTPEISLALGAITPTSVAIGAGSAITSSGAGGTLGALSFITPGTGIATALGVNVGSAGAPVLFNGAGGTPSSLTGTNITGTAAGLTAGSVTTNANLTGPITSVGNATSITSQTGTGTKFVVDTSPTLVTPALGVATATSVAAGGCTIGSFIFCSTTGNFTGALTLGTSGILVGGTNLIEQRNGANAQTFNLYETFTDTSNYSRLSSSYVSGNTRYEVGTAAAGTGTLRAIQYNAGASGGAITLNPSGSSNVISLGISGVSNYWSLTNAGNLITTQNNTVDIGANAATSPRTGYFGTSVIVQGTGDAASSTGGALQIAGGASVAKRFWIPAITASAGLQTAVLCQSSGGEMIADSVACLASSARFKNIAGPMEDGALAKIASLQMRRWSYKPEGIFHNDVEHVGPIAEDVAAMDPRLAGYDKDGNVRTYSTEQLLAFTIKAVQELKADNDNLREELKRVAK